MLKQFKRKEKNIDLPKNGEYCIGVFFMTSANTEETQKEFQNIANGYNLDIIYWRTVPVDKSQLGEVAKNSEPLIKQVSYSNIKNIMFQFSSILSQQKNT